jgi:hypothetical protein
MALSRGRSARVLRTSSFKDHACVDQVHWLSVRVGQFKHHMNEADAFLISCVLQSERKRRTSCSRRGQLPRTRCG